MSFNGWVFNSMRCYTWNPLLGWTCDTKANYAVPTNENFIVPRAYQEGLDFILKQITGPEPLAEPQ